MKDDLQLACPPPHPSDTTTTSNNPLATTPHPATAGTRVSLLTLSTRNTTPFFSRFIPDSRPAPIQEHPNEGRTSAELNSETGNTSSSGSFKTPKSSAPAFGDGNPSLEKPTGKNASKKAKPKNSMSKSNSSFISRVIVNENFSKRLQEHTPEGLYAFANINRAFQWLDISSASKQEYMTKVLFTKGHCLCHDVNMFTKSENHIDVIMGFNTGEIIWFEGISQKYTRLNKNGIINATPISEIKWIPGSENLFMASHMDGSLVVYDKEKDDAAFLPEEKSEETLNSNIPKPPGETILIEKSVQSQNQKTNPVAFWKLSNQRINAFAFSPDNRHLAVVSEDGSLRIIDYLKEE